MENLIKLPDNALTDLTKQELEILVCDIINKVPENANLEALMQIDRFEKILKQLKDSIIRTKARKQFISDFRGSTNETYLGYKIQLVNQTEYEFSEKVTELETKKKDIEIKIKAQKETEKNKGIAKETGKKEMIKLTLL